MARTASSQTHRVNSAPSTSTRFRRRNHYLCNARENGQPLQPGDFKAHPDIKRLSVLTRAWSDGDRAIAKLVLMDMLHAAKKDGNGANFPKRRVTAVVRAHCKNPRRANQVFRALMRLPLFAQTHERHRPDGLQDRVVIVSYAADPFDLLQVKENRAEKNAAAAYRMKKMRARRAGKPIPPKPEGRECNIADHGLVCIPCDAPDSPSEALEQMLRPKQILERDLKNKNTSPVLDHSADVPKIASGQDPDIDPARLDAIADMSSRKPEASPDQVLKGFVAHERAGQEQESVPDQQSPVAPEAVAAGQVAEAQETVKDIRDCLAERLGGIAPKPPAEAQAPKTARQTPEAAPQPSVEVARRPRPSHGTEDASLLTGELSAKDEAVIQAAPAIVRATMRSLKLRMLRSPRPTATAEPVTGPKQFFPSVAIVTPPQPVAGPACPVQPAPTYAKPEAPKRIDPGATPPWPWYRDHICSQPKFAGFEVKSAFKLGIGINCWIAALGDASTTTQDVSNWPAYVVDRAKRYQAGQLLR